MNLQCARQPRVAVILVNWNNWRDCIENLDSVLANDYPAFHVFVVDNDSGDSSIERIAEWCQRPRADASWRRHEGVARRSDSTLPAPAHRIVEGPPDDRAAVGNCRVTLVRAGGNLGFAGGCNLGIRHALMAGYEYFWLLNTDTVIHCDALSRLVDRARADSRLGMVGSTVLYYDRPSVVQALGGAHLHPDAAMSRHIGQGARLERDIDPTVVEAELSYIFGASMLISSELVREIGLMREDYFLYYEEIDWAMRARGKFKLGFAPGSHVFHKSGASSSKAMPMFSANYYYRNQVRFMSRFFPQHMRAVKRGLTKEAIRYGLKGQWSRARLVARILLQANDIAEQAVRSI